MACLYCGKDIGPFRLFRDSEFCSSEHRSKYGQRLGRALDQLAAPEPPPAGIAGFQFDYPLQVGNQTFTAALPAMPAQHSIRIGKSWPMSVAPALGGSFRPSGFEGDAGTAVMAGAASEFGPALLQRRLPRFELASLRETIEVEEVPAFTAPPACEAWMAAPAAQAAECWVAPRTADAPAALTELRTQVPAALTFRNVPTCESWMAAPAAQPVENWLASCMADAIPAVIETRASLPAALTFRNVPICESWMAVPAAQPVESWLAPVMANASSAVCEVHLPQMTLEAAAESFEQPAEPMPSVCESWMAAPAAQPAESWLAPVMANASSAAFEARLPQMTLEAAAESFEQPAEPVPSLCEDWMPAPAPQAVECWLAARSAEAIPAACEMHLPQMSAISIGVRYVRRVSTVVPGLDAEPATVNVFAHMDSRPALRTGPLSMLRFGLHTIDEVAPAPKAEEPPPQMAEVLPGLAASPVESMPRIAAFAARAMATLPALRLPESVALPSRPIRLANAVAGPAPVPVETLPSTGLAVPLPIVGRVAMRRPTLAHFQPVQESATGLAAPAAAAGPEILESMPQVAAFAAVPVMASLAPAMIERPLETAGTGLALLGFRVGAAPRVEAPRAGQPDSRRVSVEPLARIAAQPAGVQPERPKPAIPKPGVFALEYHCHRISSKPASHPVWMHPQISMQLLRTFPVPAALKKFAEYGATPKRKILPFEEIFALQKKRNEARKTRVNLGNAGKIAAAVMVAVALWAGSRLAGIAQQAQALRVQVTGSERGLVADGRSV